MVDWWSLDVNWLSLVVIRGKLVVIVVISGYWWWLGVIERWLKTDRN
jgi:hypothetical protein